MPEKKVDLRIQRTKENIRRVFEEMICEMDYEEMSIKELTERAKINRKTFYLHYDSLDDLLREIQNDLAQDFIKRTEGMVRPRDMDKITREFFLSQERLGRLGERITCAGSYHYVSRRITSDIMSQTWERDQNDPFTQDIIMTYLSQSTLAIYKQWVADGKRIPLEDIIDLTIRLVCHGVEGMQF
ncbi:TetR/AcrR family transcriptional regulator [bacterium D16-76]|nr:TetR/AcrR family transcriptional regulator [bacterium D16-76]